MDVTKELLDSLNGVKKSPRQRSIEEALAIIADDSSFNLTNRLQQAPVDDLTPTSPEATPTTPTKTLKAHSEHQIADLSAEEAYEIGYQEGQADLTEEYLLASTGGLMGHNITMSTSLGKETRIYSIRVEIDSPADKQLAYFTQFGNVVAQTPTVEEHLMPPSAES